MSGDLNDERFLVVTWKVQVLSHPEVAKSPTFHFRDTKWLMDCYEIDEDYIFLVLRYANGSGPSCTFKVVVEVYSASTDQVLSALTKTKNNGEPDSLIWSSDIGDVNECFYRKNQIKFRVTFKEANSCIQTAQKSVQTPIYLNQYPCLEGLSDDFAKLLETDSDSDVELLCEGHTTKAHKSVLCLRSPVLASMLHSDMVEGRTGVVKIPNIDVDTFQKFIRYLYTGKLDELTIDSATSLYEAGDMYEVRCLTKKCSNFLAENLTVENACDILIVANAHSDSIFVDAVIAFIVEKKIPQTDDRWPAYSKQNPILAVEILNYIVRN